MIKTVVISALLLGCFLVMANLVPNLLQNTRSPANKHEPEKQNHDQVIKSIVLLIGMAILLTLILHFWH
ncbi:hypothetical protein [Endozoicomonas elysicola]|uniref:Uncharacterized protein n=1 Tax=Endozoicomonas elysicola TaxID=305900 RepID=A0A081KDQ1_9GAMM|nr:hypothetical protein [Endozoicomonas elysicola]KEI72277.1 hypothetical protein GV64_17430 [Endozoicomonas elysicola]